MESADFTPIPMPLPEIYLTKHRGVEIHGESDFVIDIKEKVAISDFANIISMSPNYENLDGILLKQKGNLAILRFDPTRRRKIESGIMLCGKFAFNYFHEVYETLIKLVVVNDIPDIPQNIPLIVDAIVLRIPSLNQILNILNVRKREVIYIGKDETIYVNNLYHLSHINHIPPQRKNIFEIHPGNIIFDAERVMTMRAALLSVKSERKFPRRIFLTRRNAKVRRINEEEIIAVLKKYGFELVAPEEYTFPEQVALFNNAEFIIGGTGAAFSNLLFCEAGCKVICLVSRKQSTPVFTTLAYLNGVEMRYLSSCISHGSKGRQLHADFRIDVCTLERMVNIFMCNGSDLRAQGENSLCRPKRTTV